MPVKAMRASGPAAPSKRRLRTSAHAVHRSEPRDVALGPLGERLGYHMRRAQVAIFQDFEAACQEHDIRTIQYSILTIVEHNPGLSQTRVAQTLGIKKTNFVAMLDTLEGRGLVKRAATPGDRRTYALCLTDAGRSLVRQLHKIAAAHEGRLVALIGADAHRRMVAPLKAIARMERGASGAKRARRAGPRAASIDAGGSN